MLTKDNTSISWLTLTSTELRLLQVIYRCCGARAALKKFYLMRQECCDKRTWEDFLEHVTEAQAKHWVAHWNPGVLRRG